MRANLEKSTLVIESVTSCVPGRQIATHKYRDERNSIFEAWTVVYGLWMLVDKGEGDEDMQSRLGVDCMMWLSSGSTMEIMTRCIQPDQLRIAQ